MKLLVYCPPWGTNDPDELIKLEVSHDKGILMIPSPSTKRENASSWQRCYYSDEGKNTFFTCFTAHEVSSIDTQYWMDGLVLCNLDVNGILIDARVWNSWRRELGPCCVCCSHYLKLVYSLVKDIKEQDATSIETTLLNNLNSNFILHSLVVKFDSDSQGALALSDRCLGIKEAPLFFCKELSQVVRFDWNWFSLQLSSSTRIR